MSALDGPPRRIHDGQKLLISYSLNSSQEGTAEVIRSRVGTREFSAFVTVTVERELQGQILDEYLADYELRRGPLTAESQQAARRVFDEVAVESALGDV